MDESKLRIFECVARHKSFSKAALELHVVSSTVSRQIAALEAELNVPLFHRDTHSVELTPAGIRLQDEALSYFAHFRYINENIHNLIHRDDHRLNLAAGPYGFPMASRLAHLYRQQDPALSMMLTTYPNYHALPLRNGTANLFVTARSGADPLSEFQVTSLGRYRWKAVARKDSDFWRQPPEAQTALQGQKLVRPSGSTQTPFTEWLPDHPVDSRGTAFAQGFTVTCSQLSLEGVALMPEYLESWLPSFLRMEQVFPDSPVEEAVLIFNPDRATPQERQFFDYIRDHFQP